MSSDKGYSMFRSRALTVMITAAVVACVPTPPETPQPMARDVMFAAPPERIWSAMLVILTDANLPIENMDRSSWFMRTQEMRIPAGQADTLVDCGKTGMGDSQTL